MQSNHVVGYNDLLWLDQSEVNFVLTLQCVDVVHLFGEDIEQAREALEPVVHSLFKLSDEPDSKQTLVASLLYIVCLIIWSVSIDDKPLLLWSAYFNQEIRSVADSDKPVNMHIIADPDFELDFEQSLKQVEALFKAICPGEEFIPTVPHPEDIIWVCSFVTRILLSYIYWQSRSNCSI